MSESTLLWLFGAIVTLQTTVIGAVVTALWVHVGHCKTIAATMARIEATVERVCIDIGTHETGLRGQVHDQQEALLKMDGRLVALERFLAPQR